MPALRTIAAAAALTVLLTGCTLGTTPAPDPGTETAGTNEPRTSTQLPAVLTATDTRSLTGCPNSVGWIDVEANTLLELGVVPTTTPDSVVQWRPSGEESGGAHTEWRLTLSTDGRLAAVTSVQQVPGPATRPDRFQSLVQLYDVTTRAETATVKIPGIVFPYEACFDDYLVMSPRRSYPQKAPRHQAHVVDVVAGAVVKTIPLRPDEENEDHVATVTATHLLINRFDRARGGFALESVKLRNGRRAFTHRPNGADFAHPSTVPDTRFSRAVLGTPTGGTVVVDVRTGRRIAAMPAPVVEVTNTAVIDPFTGVAYLTDGARVTAVPLTRGKPSRLKWAVKLDRVEFDLISALDGHLVVYTKGARRVLNAATGADEGATAGAITRGGLNWAGETDEGALVALVVYEGAMDPRIQVAADKSLTQ